MRSISTSEYAQRRQQLMQQMAPNSIAILPAAAISTRNSSVEYPYRQDSDFFYLSGFAEPEAVLVLIPEREHGEFVLFCRERNPERELWDGLRAGQDGAIADYQADEAFPINAIDDILPCLLEGRERVYYSIGNNPVFDQQMMTWLKSIRSKARLGAQPPQEFVVLDHLLHGARLYKSPAEIATMQHAADISCRAHIRAMQAAKPGLYEYHLEAELDYEFRKSGARLPAYSSIVASGKNACILHYTENNAPMCDGDLVLIDAGCEIDCYASDITRTFPVNGRFSPEQKAIYTIVLQANLEAMNYISPKHRWNDAHDATVRVITAGLLELGLLQGELHELIDNEAYKPFYMHRAGHWLGLDVHDVGDYKVNGQWRTLEPGMTMTVEPGIYIAPDNLNVPAQWRGIGVRIEDDVVVTEQGCRVLTHAVPKTIEAIEAIMVAAQSAGAKAMSRVQIAIIGGGLVGASLALALQAGARERQWKIVLIEPYAPGNSYQPSYDARASALSYGSQQIYQRLGLWDVIAPRAESIHNIHISNRGRFAAARISASEEGVPALGYVVENAWLGHCLWAALDNEVIEWRCPARVDNLQSLSDGYRLDLDDGSSLECDLAILADGGRSGLREKLGIYAQHTPYGQTALISNISSTSPHQGMAFERFTDEGPMALLPLPENRSVLIWTREPNEAQRLHALPDADFLQELQACFGYRLGAIEHVGRRHLYPLSLIESSEQIRSNLVVLGNAAHSLHPVAGQGYNLSLRDSMALAEILLAGPDTPGDLATLQGFQNQQQLDQELTIGFSDRVTRLFSNDKPVLASGRNLGLLGLDLLPPAKRWFSRQAMGLGVRSAQEKN